MCDTGRKPVVQFTPCNLDDKMGSDGFQALNFPRSQSEVPKGFSGIKDIPRDWGVGA